FLSPLRRPPTPPSFPYTTLFRSWRQLVKRICSLPDGKALARAGPRQSFSMTTFCLHPAGARAAGICLSPPLGKFMSGFCRNTVRSEEHTSELQSRFDLVCRLLLE